MYDFIDITIYSLIALVAGFILAQKFSKK
ncbi:hypothetical protein NMYAN_20284 [Nitrosomonas nitrosa]|uniref:Uncharacterized protein n=1 Tax=Nitrosomonas nitrosa TaxID=52442 RepID=A0A8H8YZ24_9PROT|nr:hypothetical protein NMYAN_20284 [Nitrosomonas nitrosa]